jgi:hypothetical protein
MAWWRVRNGVRLSSAEGHLILLHCLFLGSLASRIKRFKQSSELQGSGRKKRLFPLTSPPASYLPWEKKWIGEGGGKREETRVSHL